MYLKISSPLRKFSKNVHPMPYMAFTILSHHLNSGGDAMHLIYNTPGHPVSKFRKVSTGKIPPTYSLLVSG